MIIQLCCTVLHGFVTLPLPRHLFFFCSCPSFLDEPREETLATQAMHIQATPPLPYECVEEEEHGMFFASNGNSEKVRAPYGIQPTTLRDLVGCSNH